MSSSGTDNAIYRLGAYMAVRLPRIHWAIMQPEREYTWLPKLAPFLPLAIPVPLALGEPGEGYPWRWSVCRWLEGENATVESVGSSERAAKQIAHFVNALQEVDPTGGPPPGEYNSDRGVPLATRDAATRHAITALRGILDDDTLRAATRVWDAAVSAPLWDRRSVWIHGDIQGGNLLQRNGELSAAIDFGCLGVGDPACDLQVAWNLLTPESRKAFRSTVHADNAAWLRGKGWALSVALIALPYYVNTNKVIADNARRAIAAILSDGIVTP